MNGTVWGGHSCLPPLTLILNSLGPGNSEKTTVGKPADPKISLVSTRRYSTCDAPPSRPKLTRESGESTFSISHLRFFPFICYKQSPRECVWQPGDFLQLSSPSGIY